MPSDEGKLVLVQVGTDVIVLIGGRGIQLFGHHPDLKEFRFFGVAAVHLTVVDIPVPVLIVWM